MSSAPASVTAVIAAAGSGGRLGAGGPKAFVPLAGRPMVEWSVAAFRAAGVASIVVACPPGRPYEPGAAVERADASDRPLKIVEGGETRSQSVANALEAVETGVVAIHDAARPLVTPQLIEEVVATLIADPDAAGAIAAAPLTDTIKQAAPITDAVEQPPPITDAVEQPAPSTKTPLTAHEAVNGVRVVDRTLDRDRLWAAQTPQAFRVDALRRAIEADPDAAAAATDEAMLVEAAGGRVLICPAPPENLKVTRPLDLQLAEWLLGQQ